MDLNRDYKAEIIQRQNAGEDYGDLAALRDQKIQELAARGMVATEWDGSVVRQGTENNRYQYLPEAQGLAPTGGRAATGVGIESPEILPMTTMNWNTLIAPENADLYRAYESAHVENTGAGYEGQNAGHSGSVSDYREATAQTDAYQIPRLTISRPMAMNKQAILDRVGALWR